MTWGSNAMHFVYDALGAAAVIYNGTTYCYLRNAMGDIVGIVDSTGAQVVAYTYDVWGKLLTTTGTMATTLGQDNPLRYRGYVYDTETGLYYLTNRYYNPTWGRFISADIFASTGQGIVGCNMFAYCNNNPINMVDYLGGAPEWWQVTISIVSIVGGLVLTATGVGGFAGAALIAAGASSLIMGAVNESQGKSYSVGWSSGYIGGAIAGAGAGLGGIMLEASTALTGASMVGALVTSLGVSYAAGVASNYTSGFLIATGNEEYFDQRGAFRLALLKGTTNIVSAVGCGIGAGINSAGTSSAYACLAVLTAITTQALCDGLSYLADNAPVGRLVAMVA